METARMILLTIVYVCSLLGLSDYISTCLTKTKSIMPSWLHVLNAFSLFIVIMLSFVLMLMYENKDNKPKFELITEPVYKQIK